jgi:hypothetical protein
MSMTLEKLIAALQALDLPADTPVKVYDPN